MSTQTQPSIVFAHGLWADASSYRKVIPALQAEGHQVVAAQNPLDSLAGDVATVRRALGRVNSPAILVGYSYGGTVITAAGTDERVAGRVEARRHRLEVEAQLVHRGQQRSQRPTRAATLRCEAYGRHHL